MVLGLKELRVMERVGVEGNHLKDEGIRAFSEAVLEYTKLKELFVQDNEFGDIGAAALSHSLENKPLTLLNISENHISATGLECLLRVCASLETLELAYNSIGPAGGQLLLSQWPPGLTRLAVTCTAIGDELEQALLSNSSQTQVLI